MEEKQITLDGTFVTQEELQEKVNELQADPEKLVTEVSPGTWKTLERLRD